MIGGLLQKALAAVGITEARVESWLGRPCGCAERAAKLDRLEAAAKQWAKAELLGKGPNNMRRHIEGIIGEDTDDDGR